MKRCVDCGNEFPKEELNRKGCCQECAMKRLREAAEQMEKREGPYYEKWLASKEKAIENYRKSQEKALARYKQSLESLEYLASPVGQAEMIIRCGKLLDELED